jgi:hypothetical protein
MLDLIRDAVETMVFSQNVVVDEEGNEQVEGFFVGTGNEMLTIVLMIFVILLIVFILGKYLWNNYLVEAVPGIKPLKSVTQFVAIWFVTQTLFTK